MGDGDTDGADPDVGIGGTARVEETEIEISETEPKNEISERSSHETIGQLGQGEVP